MEPYIEALNWRYATKTFDASKKISTEDLDTLKKAIQLTASSYGLQPYTIFIVEDPETRKKLLEASYGQPQITEASQIVVFANMTTFDDTLVDDYITNASETRGIAKSSLQDYANTMKSTLSSLSPTEKSNWTAKQAYIALGNLLSAAATLRIDACPMEGLQSDQYNEILGLNSLNLNAAVIATIGYRSSEDDTQHYAKVRKPLNELFTTI